MSFLSILAVLASGAWTAAASPPPEYLTDLQDRFISMTQAWGELGMNVCAHQAGQPGLPLQIGQRRYRRGLGHHAPGEISIALEGEYSRFEADVGVQHIDNGGGSVVFKVLVDGQERFASGLMRMDTPPKQVSVPLDGAQELRLVVTDGGDGIMWDCANWADARLIRNPDAERKPLVLPLDVAPFARVVTSDPARMQGARAGRTQEYLAEDIYLEKDVASSDAGYDVPVIEGRAVIGLNWLERRAIRQVAIVFAEPPQAEPGSVEIQGWSGGTAWQGKWVHMEGQVEPQSGGGWLMRINTRANPEFRQGTRKIRWIIPAQRPLRVKQLQAWTPTPVENGTFELQLDEPRAGKGVVTLYNGTIRNAGQGQALRSEWDLNAPLRLDLTFTRPLQWNTDRTVLRVELPEGAFGIGIDDILANEAVYVRDFGLFAAPHPVKISRDAYKNRISEQKTILQRVRAMPDQTLERAIEAIHNPKQDLLPTMLSLACDNRKFIVHRSGLVQRLLEPEKPNQARSMQMQPKFGFEKAEVSRKLHGDWLPIPLTTTTDGGITCRQRTLVAPFETDVTPALFGWIKQRPVCVSRFTFENLKEEKATASISLTFHANAERNDLAEVESVEGGAIAHRHGRLLAAVHFFEPGDTQVEAGDGTIVIRIPLGARMKRSFDVLMPGWTMPVREQAQLRVKREWVADARRHWDQVMAPAARIEVPDPLISNLIRASQVHCLVAARNEEDGTRIAPWIASVSYGPLESEGHSIIRGMDVLGHAEFARRALDFFIHRYSPEGYLTTGYTMMGTGWNLWTLAEHVERSRDEEWIRPRAAAIAKVCDWIIRQRQKTMNGVGAAQPPEYGFVPPGVMADWNAYAYYFCLNGYYCAGLRDAARVLKSLGVPEADGYIKAAAEYQEDLHRAWRWTQARMPVYALQDGTWVPGYPSQVHGPGPTANFFPGEDGNRSWCYDVELGSHHLVPFGLLDPSSRDVSWMMDHMEDVQFLAEGWFDYSAERNHKDPINLGGFAKVQPYYCRNAEIDAMRDDVKPFIRSYFNTLCSLLNRENLSFQEHFAGVAAWNKTHETGYFLHQSRLMMVMERGDALWLTPFVTSQWMQDGMTVGLRNAPTRFGTVAYRIKSVIAKGFIEATIEPPTRTPPAEIVIRLRHPQGKPMTKVLVNDQPHTEFDAAKEIVRLPVGKGPITVRAEY